HLVSDGTPLARWLEAEGIPHKLLHENTYAIVTDKIPAGNTYCSLCSRLRRGILYRAAGELGCNKIALGHHRDDAAETLLLNLFFRGALPGMPAMLRSDDRRNTAILLADDARATVIRPLIDAPEAEIAEYAALRRFPIIPCDLWGTQEQLQRKRTKRLLEETHRGTPHTLLR